MPTIKTMEGAYRAANDPMQYRGLNEKEAKRQRERARLIGSLLNQAKIRKMAEA